MRCRIVKTAAGELKERGWAYGIFIIITLAWIGMGEYMAACAVFFFIAALFFADRRRIVLSDTPFLLLLGLFTLNNVISSLFSIDRATSAALSLLWFLVILIPVASVRFSLDGNDDFVMRLILPFSIGAAVVIVAYMSVGFGITLAREGLAFRRYSFKWLGTSQTADTMVMLGCLGYGWFRQKRAETHRWLGFVYLLMCAFGLFLTLDRGGIAAYFVVMIILLAHDWKRLILLFVLLAVLVFLSYKIESLHVLRYPFDYLTARYRFEIVKSGQQIDTFRTSWLIIRDHWLLGVGTNNFSKFTKEYGNGHWYAYAHNFILQFWAENGIFGMGFGLSIMGLVISRFFRALKHSSSRYVVLGTGCAFIGMLLENLTNSTIWIIKIALPFWLIAGMLCHFYRSSEIQRKNQPVRESLVRRFFTTGGGRSTT